MSKRVASEISEVASNLSNAAAKLSRTGSGTDANPTSLDTDEPVVVIHDYIDDGKSNSRTKSSKSDLEDRNNRIFDPQSTYLLDDMLYPLSREEFLKNHFRKNAVCIQRRRQSEQTKNGKDRSSDSADEIGNEDMVSLISEKYLFGLDVHQIFAETSSQNVFLWLRPPLDSPSSNALNSVEISDPDTAYALHQSGSHPAYCRAPPLLEQLLVSSLLRATGLGGGHYHPPHSETVTLGGNTTLGRGEVELFIGAKNAEGKTNNGETHTTGHHTDFQENFTIQISGVKQWTLKRGRVRHPLRATTPHYLREQTVVENQLKVARLCLNGNDPAPDQGLYGFEYSDNNAYGQEQTITLYPGDVLYFPSGMWHTVTTVEPGVSLNVSLMGTTYATVVCEALQHLLVGSDERWREIVTSRPGDVDAASSLKELLKGLAKTVDDFVTNGGGAQSILPPALCHPPLQPNGENDNDPMPEADASVMDSDEEMDSEHGFEGAQTSSELTVDIDSFTGPAGWSCKKPPNGKLIKNPLALLLSKEEVTAHDLDEDTDEAEPAKQYILNVNYAGNEMFESHIRVTLVTEKYIDWMESYLTPGDAKTEDRTPPDCLFFYGLFSWAS